MKKYSATMSLGGNEIKAEVSPQIDMSEEQIKQALNLALAEQVVDLLKGTIFYDLPK